MKEIKTIDAVGHILCHDITQIIKDKVKDRAFKKGHIIKKEDIPVLLSLGKDHLYVWEQNENTLHEDDAAKFIYNFCKNEYMHPSEVKEGKIDIIADVAGLFCVDTKRLIEVNCLDQIIIATRHTNFPVKKGDKLAGTRVIPLVIEKDKLQRAAEIVGATPLLKLFPFKKLKVGIVTTGSEIFYGRIKDTFTPVIIEKLKNYDLEVIEHFTVNDDEAMIIEAILKLKSCGCEMILCTGGMSVDPDDRTPSAIKSSGATIITYGAPVLPGAMFLLGYFEDSTPIMGLPGCVMYAKNTIFDLILPRVIAGTTLSKCDFAVLSHGGLCLQCDTCSFPNCSFGKGV
ncbi:molybdopterin-binding protein [Clostridium lacusfryxellense]|uniref:molybdopterin-binding protein n=1 Tax=Clostridium lacusfryxellense TaxID=205328 RepID=UPI001C0AB1D3|nr:molybdopterin-binding protein [Clostridium lacusfryxellense]MBU3112624.1 molybdopterin-binding protein [Clostridium lacusfryxellense]